MAMTSYLVDDDKDLDDAALWAVIDSAAAAASYSSTTTAITTTTANSRFRKPLTLKNPYLRSSPQVHLPSSPSPPPSNHKPSRNYALNPSPRVSFDDWDDSVRLRKTARSEMSESSPDLKVVKRGGAGGFTPVYSSPEIGRIKQISPYVENNSPQIEYRHSDEKEKAKDTFTHCLSGRFPTVSLFKDYQDAAIKILDKSDYTLISGNPFIKKSGWRKIAFYFNISFEIKDKSIEFDENRNVQRAEFVVRAHMQGGRFSDGWGSCERREKKFLKPNNDIPSTAETRAKNKACQDLLGIGAYRTSEKYNHSSY